MGHYCGVQPEHVAEFIGDTNDVRTKGLGLVSKLSDEAVLNILGFLDAQSLAILQSVSKAFYCFCNHEELWKALVLQEFAGNWEFQGTWQDTYLASKLQTTKNTNTPAAAAALTKKFRNKPRTYLPISHFYSDLLHQSWLCATLEVDSTWLEVENIDRRSNLSVEDFKMQYERHNRPVILADIVTKWPAMTKWSRSYLQKAFKNGSVIVGDAPMKFEAYCHYADSQQDELPLYLFDKEFSKTAPQLAKDYFVPEHFSEDLFSVLGEEARPDYRWLIAGPHKSGS
jgi:F-box domain